jgi:glycine/D-amino acid oxidase-like deaminating enzyme
MNSYDVLILGAGIVGAACACECAAAGLRVGIIDPGVPGGAASAAGMGHLVVMDDSTAQLALSRFSRELWRDLQNQLPPQVEYEQRGTLWVAADAEEMDEVLAKHRTYGSMAVASEVLDAAALRQAEPNLRSGLAGALLVPHDAVIYPPAATGYFLASALRQNANRPATLLRGVRPVKAADGMVTLQDGTRIAAGKIVIATGVDTTLVPWLNVQRRKGHLVITDRYPGFVHHQLVELGYLKSAHKSTEDSMAFNVQPRQNGQLLIGSSRQYGDLSTEIDSEILRKMMERAVEYLPSLQSVSVLRVWTGFRAAMLDKLPVIGPTPDPSILLAMGFEGLGITNAPGAARLILSHILQQEFAIDPAPYLPSLAPAPVLHA